MRNNYLHFVIIKQKHKMKKLLYFLVTFFSLSFYGQSRSDIINAYVQSSEQIIGVEENGLIGMKLINENNNTIVYQYRCSSKKVADYYKFNGTKEILILSSPNDFTRRLKSYKIIAKWRYYFNNKVVKELTVYPNEWND